MRVALFVTCLVDLFRPEVAEATVRILERCGCTVVFPEQQTCCGQAFFNAGYREQAVQLAETMIRAFEGEDYLVAPSGSCVAMVRHDYPSLFADRPDWQARAQALADRTFELSEFLSHILDIDPAGLEWVPGHDWGAVAYHASCHLSRLLGVSVEPRALLSAVPGLELVEVPYPDQCCGFGGTFSIKQAPVSTAMADAKLAAVREVQPRFLVAADLGCLLHLGGRAARAGLPGGGPVPRVLHVAELVDRALGGPQA